MSALQIAMLRGAACSLVAAIALAAGNPYFEGPKRRVAMFSFAGLAILLFVLEPLA